uniref:hypothetical protein n=1 Tax=Candidatus Ichthyocystis sparus TaxID=1561004 RepID=UPI000A5BF3A5
MYPVPVAGSVASSGDASEDGASNVDTVRGVDLQQAESSPATTSTTPTTTGMVVSASGSGEATAPKPGTSTVLPSSATTVSKRGDTAKSSRKRGLKKLGDVSCEDFSRAAGAVGFPPVVEFSVRSDTSRRSLKSGLKKLSDVSCEDFSRAAGAAGVPVVEFSVRSDISNRGRKRGLKKLGDVSCEDFSRATDATSVSAVEFSIGRDVSDRSKKHAIKSKTSESSSRCAIESTESGSSAISTAHSSTISSSQLDSELLSRFGPQPNLHLQSEVQSSSSSATIASTAAGRGKVAVHTRGKGKSPAPKRGISVAVSSSAAATGEAVDVESSRGFYAQNPASSSPYCASICAMVLPECALMIKDLFSKVGAFARSIYRDMISKQLPPGISGKLSVTERAIWYWTYMKMCEANFVFKCLGEYHAKHRPGFVCSLSKIKLLSDSEAGLLDFLLELDCAIRREAESIFSSCWSEVSVSLKEESLGAISCRDFVRVLSVAGIPEVALSASVESYVRGGSRGKSVVAPVTSVVDLTRSSSPSSQLSPSQSDNISASVSTEVRTLTASTIPISSSNVSLSVKCVDLLDVKLHPDSAKLIYNLFFMIRISAQKSCLSVLNCLLKSVDSELSILGKAIWCRTYRELHLLNFMAKCLCYYHSKYRPDFIHSIADIRVLSSSSDHMLVPLGGGAILDFLSKLDLAVNEELRSIFNLNWDEAANKVFAELEDGSLGAVGCEDFIDVLNVAGIPEVAYSISKKYAKYQRCLINKSKNLEGCSIGGVNIGGCSKFKLESSRSKSATSKSNTSGSSASTDPVVVSTVFAQPGSVSVTDTVVSTVAVSPGGTGSSLPIILLISLPQLQSQPGLFSLPLPLSAGPSLPLATESVASNQPSDVSVVDTVSTVAVSPGGTGSSLPVIDPVSVPDVYGDYFLTVGEDVVVSTEGTSTVIDVDELPIEEPSSSLVPLPSSTSVAELTVYDQPIGVSVIDTVSTVAVSPGDTGSSLP